jgi:hypothetical protein
MKWDELPFSDLCVVIKPLAQNLTLPSGRPAPRSVPNVSDLNCITFDRIKDEVP